MTFRFAALALAAMAALVAAWQAPLRPVRHRIEMSALTTRPRAITSPEQASPVAPMRLGAASNFSQGWNEAMFSAALALPLTNWRDSIRWADVEKTKGQYTFETPMTRFPERLAAGGARLTLTLNWGNPLYDGGQTPHSPEALAAFSRFVSELVRRYPAIDTIEVGNEINGANFVNGPVKDADLAGRRAYHLAMVVSAAEGVRSAHARVRVIGGSVHSLPGGFLWPLLDAPGATYLQGLALHPYTTPIDQLPAQIGVLRRQSALRKQPLHVTEFGSQNPQTAPDELVRSYATLASRGAAEMDWYPLGERGDGFVPLLRRDGTATTAGRAFRFVTEQLASMPARNLSPDPFTFIHAFGPNLWVVWGAPRAIRLDPVAVTALDATGARIDNAGLKLDEARVLILRGRKPLVLGENVSLDCSPLVADSFLGFTFPDDPVRPSRAPPGFTAYAQTATGRVPLATMPGQQNDGVPWTPYLGRKDAALPRLAADIALPGPGAELLLGYRPAHTRTLHIVGEFTAANPGAAGAAISFSGNDGQVSLIQHAPHFLFDRQVQAQAGRNLTFSIGWNGTARDSATRYRIRVFDPAACPSGRPSTGQKQPIMR